MQYYLLRYSDTPWRQHLWWVEFKRRCFNTLGHQKLSETGYRILPKNLRGLVISYLPLKSLFPIPALTKRLALTGGRTIWEKSISTLWQIRKTSPYKGSGWQNILNISISNCWLPTLAFMRFASYSESAIFGMNCLILYSIFSWKSIYS